tara:strand:- start:10325 stop:11200 length:876 start_codon:yes stop_codon:yes gene_type:complete
MDKDFVFGRILFKKPHIQFNKPNLEGLNLGLYIKDLFPLSEKKESQKISIDEIYVSSEPPQDHRLLKADTSFPIWVVEGLVNKNNERYMLIDGKHRITILKRNGINEVECIVFSAEEIRKVIKIFKQNGDLIMDQHNTAYCGQSEIKKQDETPNNFWNKSFSIFKNTVRLEGFENQEVYVHHIDLRHLLIKKNIKTILIKDCKYSPRDFNSDKYKNTNLSYPIITTDVINKKYLYSVLDGHTRVNKAVHRGFTSIPSYVIPYFELEKHMFFYDEVHNRNISIYEQRKLMGK